MPPALFGITLKIISVFLVVIIAALVKAMPEDLPISEIMFFRVFLAIPMILFYLYFLLGRDIEKVKAKIRPKRPWLHVRRSFFGMSSMALIFLSVRLLPLPIANALKELSPIFITIIAATFMGETIRIYRLTGLLLGVVGVGIITWQALQGSLAETLGVQAIYGAIAGITAAVTIALAQTQIRSMVKTESPESIVFFFFVLTSFVTICFLPFGWVWPQKETWVFLILLGIFGGGAQLLLTTALHFADASTIAPFEYFSIPITLIVSALFFAEWPDPLSLLGIMFILCGGLIIIYRESRKNAHHPQPISR